MFSGNPVKDKFSEPEARAETSPDWSHLDLDVDPSGQLKMHQLVNRPAGWIQDVNQPLMSLDVKMLSGVFVRVGRSRHRKPFRSRRQGNWPHDLSSSAEGSTQNFLRTLVNDAMVISF